MKVSRKLFLKIFVFQQDNASVHVSKLSTEFFEKNNIETLKWPAQSPDLNPIENLWAIIKHELRLRNFSDLASLKEEIKRIWENFDKKVRRNLVESMKKRLIECVERKGDYTSY